MKHIKYFEFYMNENSKPSYSTSNTVINGVNVVNDENFEMVDLSPLMYVWCEYPTYKELNDEGRLIYNYEYYKDNNDNKYLVVSNSRGLADASKLIAKANWGMARNPDEFVNGADVDDYEKWKEMIS